MPILTLFNLSPLQVQGNEMMGNTHIYDVSAAIKVPGPAITPGEAQSGETSTKVSSRVPSFTTLDFLRRLQSKAPFLNYI